MIKFAKCLNKQSNALNTHKKKQCFVQHCIVLIMNAPSLNPTKYGIKDNT